MRARSPARPFTSAEAVGRWVAQHGLAALVAGWLRGHFRGPASVSVSRWLGQWWRGLARRPRR